MKGRELPSYIHRRKRDGKLLFRKRSGSRVVEIPLQTQFPEGAPVPFALHQERERLLSQPAAIPQGKTLSHVIERYQRSPKFTDLGDRTRKDYIEHLGFLQSKIGHLEPRSIKRHHIISWVDAWAEQKSAHKANYRLRILRIIMERAIDYGLLEQGNNSAKGVSELKYDKRQRMAWPENLVEAARAEATGRTALLFELLLGTGQRIGDVLDMRWKDFDGEAISVVQNKRGAKLWIPAPAQLLDHLRRAERRSIFILTNERATAPWSYRGAHDAMMKLRRKIGAESYDMHSLRYTATAELARAGLDDDKIMSITGHKTSRMVQLYAGEERQKARAKAALKAREGGKKS